MVTVPKLRAKSILKLTINRWTKHRWSWKFAEISPQNKIIFTACEGILQQMRKKYCTQEEKAKHFSVYCRKDNFKECKCDLHWSGRIYIFIILTKEQN